MFIKIKAQSSDLEKQYIKERDIFKKKRNGPKLLLSVILIAAIGGYFYYLNSGNSPQTNETTIASTGLEETNIQAQNGVISDDLEPDDSQSQLITEALANNESQQGKTIQDDDYSDVNDQITDDNIIAVAQTEESLTDIPNIESKTADIAIAQQKTEGLRSNSDSEIDGEIDSEGSVQDQPIEIIETENLAIDNTEIDISTASIEEELAQVAIAEIETEQSSLTENIDQTHATEETAQAHLLTENSETEKVEINDVELANVIDEQSQQEDIARIDNTLNEVASEATNQTPINASSDEPELAIIDETDEQAADENVSAEVLSSNVDTETVVDQDIKSSEEVALEITDHSLTAEEPQPASSTSTVEKVKESHPVKAISKMISNVFAKSNDSDERKELVADVIEIDFSKVTTPDQGKEQVAIVTVTDSVEPAYQGSSVEELTQSNNESINSADLSAVKVTTYEISETEVNEFIDKEKLINASETLPSISGSIESVFEGVDSIAAVEIPNITELTDKAKTPENLLSKTNNQSETENKTTAAVVKIETVEAAKIEPKSIKNINQSTVTEDKDTIAAATTTEIEETSTSNKSTITIKDLYDQLMTEQDENKTSTTDNKKTIDNTKKITVKQIYEKIAKTEDTKQAAAIEKTGVISEQLTEATDTTIKVKIDPDQSLAIAEPTVSNAPLEIIEEAIIDNSSIAEQDENLDTNEIETASINPKQLTDNKGSTPLMIAALNADLQTVRELVQQGAQINKRNDWGWTALLNATIKGNKPLVEYLLKNGASPHLADNDGRSPLMAAVLNNHPEIVKTLLNYDADVNKSNRDGWTALSFAAWKGNTASVKYLLEANAFRQQRTSEGLTPLQLAKQGGHTEVIKLLSL